MRQSLRGTNKSSRWKSGRCWCCSTAGPACFERAWCRGASASRKRPARNSKRIRCLATSRLSAGMPQKDADRAGAHRGPRALEEGREEATWLVPLVDLESGAERNDTLCRLGVAWEERDDERVRNLATAAVAKIRQQANVGVMGDAFADEMFCRAGGGGDGGAARRSQCPPGKLRFRPSASIRGDCRSRFCRVAGRAPARIELQYHRQYA